MKIKLIAIMLLALCTAAGGAHADPGNYSSGTNLKPIMKLIDDAQYDSAIVKLQEELEADPDNADLLSLLGFSYRKTSRFDDALGYYQRALEIEPKHRGAHEYLGQLYVDTNQLDKAKQQLEILDDLCFFKCKEFRKLKKAIDNHPESVSNS